MTPRSTDWGLASARRVVVRDRRADPVRRPAGRRLDLRRARRGWLRARGRLGLEAAAGVATARGPGALGPRYRGGRGRGDGGGGDAAVGGGMVERRAAVGGRLQPAELAFCARGRAHDRRWWSTRSCAQSRSGAGTWPGGGSSCGRGQSPRGPISSGSRSARCRPGSACAVRGAASPAPTRQARSPATPFPRPPRGPADSPRPLNEASYRLELLGLGRPSVAPAAGRASGRRPARGDARLHRWLLHAAALERRAASHACSSGPARCPPRATCADLPHRLPLEFRAGRYPRAAARDQRRRRGALHEHGAPVRPVAPGRRGFEWVKCVRVELHDGPDPGAPASTVWSSFTPEGRGAA